MALTNQQVFDTLYFLKWRCEGHTYTGDDTYAYAHTLCKENNVQLFKSEIDLDNKVLNICGYRKGEKVLKSISLEEFKGYKSPYVTRDIYLVYKDREYLRQELELFCWEYIRRNCNTHTYDSFRVSHKTSEIIIKYGYGMFKKSIRVPLDSVEDILLKIVNEKECIC